MVKAFWTERHQSRIREKNPPLGLIPVGSIPVGSPYLGSSVFGSSSVASVTTTKPAMQQPASLIGQSNFSPPAEADE